MTTIVKNYPIFEPNQVLTSTQLNNLATYLDQQNRLTRVKLIGIGIVCGLELKCFTDPDSIQITKGVGVTSEGFLTPIGEDCIATRYRIYQKPEAIDYAPFDDAKDITLFELLTDKATTGPDDVVEDITKDFLADKVILLFVECFDNDLKSCLGKSCDQLGIDRIFNIRKLAVSWEDAQAIQEQTTSIEVLDKSYSLPDIRMPRVLFNPSEDHSKYYLDFSRHYVKTLAETYFKIVGTLPQTYEDCLPILGNIYNGNPFEDAAIKAAITKWTNFLNGVVLNQVPYFGVQYFYDYVKELLLTYQELKETICGLYAVCCPDMGAFPKHLFLGWADPTTQQDLAVEMGDFRQEFLQPPIYNHYAAEVEKARLLHQRLVLQLELFDLDALIEKATQKITPSCEKKSTLSQRSIPFYYLVGRSSKIIPTQNIESVWAYQPCKNEDYGVLSYSQNTMSEAIASPLETPLHFDLDPYNFLRIEGHVGKNIKEVLAVIRHQKERYNLAFDVKAVYLGDIIDGNGGIRMPDCLCSDLQPTYAIWRHKMLYFINNLLRFTYKSKSLVLSSSAYVSASVKPFQSQAKVVDSAIKSMVNPDMLKKASTIERMAAGEEDAVSDSAVRLINYINDIDSISRANQSTKSNRYIKAATKERLSLIDQLNACLQDLVKATKPGIKDMSDLEGWLASYKCLLQVNIDNMKLQAEQSQELADALRNWVVLFIYCLLHKLLQAIAIYPYISIRLLVDTLNTRMEGLEKSFKFSNFIQNHPGVDHQAGVMPGGTFLLLFQLPHEFPDPKDNGPIVNLESRDDLLIALEQDLIYLEQVTLEGAAAEQPFVKEVKTPARQKSLKAASKATAANAKAAAAEVKTRGAAVETALGRLKRSISGLKGQASLTSADQAEIEKIAAALEGMVIGDFTLPYLCCDDCADIPAEVVSLDPLAVPQCGVVLFRQKPDLVDANDGLVTDPQFPQDFEYQPLEVQMLNNLYDPSIYQVRISSAAKLGNHTFIEAVYEPMPNLRKQIFQYTVDAQKVATESKSSGRLLVVEELDYEIFDLQRNEVVDKSTMTIFIFNLNYVEVQTVTIGGHVMENIDGQNNPLFGVPVKISDLSGRETKTDNSGGYQFDGVPVGTHTVEVTLPLTRYFPVPPFVANFMEDNLKVDFFAQRINLAGGIFDVLPVDYLAAIRVVDEAQGVAVRNYYLTNMESYNNEVEVLVEKGDTFDDQALVKVKDAVATIATDKAMTAATLNKNFTQQRDALLKTIDQGGTGVSSHKSALKVLTFSYLDRMALLQPKTVAASTINTLKGTSNVYNANANVKLKTALTQWQSSVKGKAGEEYLKAVTENLNLT